MKESTWDNASQVDSNTTLVPVINKGVNLGQ